MRVSSPLASVDPRKSWRSRRSRSLCNTGNSVCSVPPPSSTSSSFSSSSSSRVFGFAAASLDRRRRLKMRRETVMLQTLQRKLCGHRPVRCQQQPRKETHKTPRNVSEAYVRRDRYRDARFVLAHCSPPKQNARGTVWSRTHRRKDAYQHVDET